MLRYILSLRNRNNESYCGCLHVRTGTVLIGIWHLILQCAAVIFIGVLIFQHSSTSSDYLNTYETVVTDHNTSDEFRSWHFHNNHFWPFNKKFNLENQCFAVLIVVICFLLTVLMITGTMRGRSHYLLPFFCIQIFDFLLTCLTVMSYFTSSVNLQDWLLTQHDFPGKQFLIKVDSAYFTLCAIVVVGLTLSVKLYFINVVWACYKHLQSEEQSNPNAGNPFDLFLNLSLRRNQGHQQQTSQRLIEPEAEVLLPPKYEDAVKEDGELAASGGYYVEPPPEYQSELETERDESN